MQENKKHGYTDAGPIPDYEPIFAEGAETEAGDKNAGKGILRRIFRKNAGNLAVSGLLYFIKNSSTYVLPIVLANIINAAIEGGDTAIRTILINAAVALAFYIQNIPMHYVYARFTDKKLRTISAGIRNSLIKKLQHLSLSYHNAIESGRVQSKFLRDIEAIETFMNHFTKTILPTCINLVVSIVVVLFKSPIVMLFFVAFVPLNIGFMRLFRRPIKENNTVMRKEVESMSAKVTNMMEMIPVTKAHGLEEQEIEDVEGRVWRLREKSLQLDRTNAIFGASAWVFSQIVALASLTLSGILAYKGYVQPGDIVIFQTYFNTMSNSLNSILNLYPELAKGTESLRSVSEIMLSDKIEDNKDKIPLRYVHGTVQFRDVFYRYPGTGEDVIHDFSLDVSPGECIAVVGSSGSGKTTLMNMIIGFLPPTKGRLIIDGKDIEYLNLSTYRHFLSVVPQNTILFTGTIRENILYGVNDISEKRFQEVIDMANIREFIDELPDGLDTQVEEHGANFSGGQKQRISIARALIRDPKILILDEATSALDNISEYHVQQAISRLIKGRTTFIVAHRLSTIRDADRIVVMEGGTCVEVGTYDELMAKKGKFYELKSLNDRTTALAEEALK